MTYSDKLKDPRWLEKRQEIIKRDLNQCQLCGENQATLQVHHKYYIWAEPWEYPNEALVTYCLECHDLVEYCKSIGHILPVRTIHFNHPDKSKYILTFFKDRYTVRFSIVQRGLIGFDIGISISDVVMQQIMEVFKQLSNA